jgi:hypothetical protein
VQQHFISTVSCNNPKCKERYTITGEISVWDDSDEEEAPHFIEHYYPRYIFPVLHFFELPEDIPYEVEETLSHSFKLYWIDASACANAIRRTLELILTNNGVKKTELSSSRKKKTLTLHRRIELFETKNPQVAGWLMATKWIGNAGSHIEDINSEQLLDAFDLLRNVLYKLYSRHEKEIESMAKSINKRRKPLD